MNKQGIWDGLRDTLGQFAGDKLDANTMANMKRMATDYLMGHIDETGIDPATLRVFVCANDKTFIHICTGGFLPEDGCRP